MELSEMEQLLPYITVTNSVITVLIGGFVGYVGFMQLQVNRNRFKLDLFEKRFSVYKATQVFLTHILSVARVDLQQLFEFRAGTQDAVFLFGDEVPRYLKQIDSKALRCWTVKETYEDTPVGEERSKLCKEEEELLSWLLDQLPKLTEVFLPYLEFKTWK